MGETLDQMLHAERTENNTLNVDCWACEAARSPAIEALLDEAEKRARKAEAAASHTHAVFVAAVPDEDAQLALWRDHWRTQLDALAAPLTPAPAPDAAEGKG